LVKVFYEQCCDFANRVATRMVKAGQQLTEGFIMLRHQAQACCSHIVGWMLTIALLSFGTT